MESFSDITSANSFMHQGDLCCGRNRTPRRIHRDQTLHQAKYGNNTPMTILVHQELSVPSKAMMVCINPSINTPESVPANNRDHQSTAHRR